ncbi:hypothetical protein D1007_24340 [Hordeum vulgare]|nr:hypothetical protein D1007_24340 [Hordeum vulgare]
MRASADLDKEFPKRNKSVGGEEVQRVNDVIEGAAVVELADGHPRHVSPQQGKTSFVPKKWGNLLDVSKFSAPEGLLEWFIDRIDPKLGEFRNPRNNTSILFTPEMVEKVLGLPHGTRHVVVISKHEESPHREFYKTDYDHGRWAPIHYAATILEKEADLDDETFFRTFFLVALATHLTPGTGNMVPLEYLGSLEVASEELPAFLLQIIERHKSKWAQDISKATSRLSKLHAKRMEEFAQDVLAATKDNAPDPTNSSSPHWAKLSVPEDKFVATNCLREFNNAYQDGSLKSKDMLYFAIPHKQHWILCCINLLYKQINIFDSDKKLKNDEVYELSNNLVTKFTTLAAHAKAFTKLDFMKFTCFNPPDCPQQKTQIHTTIGRLSPN